MSRPPFGRYARLAAVALLACAAAAPAQTTLRYQFKAGQVLDYVADAKMKMNTAVDGKDVEIGMTMTMEMSWKVAKVLDGGDAKLEIKYDRVKMVMDAPEPVGRLTLDSADKEEPDNPVGRQMHAMLKVLCGSAMTATMTARGEIKDAKVPKELDELLQKFGGGPAGGLGDAMNFLVLPQGAVTRGKTWDDKREMSMPMVKAVVDTKYTYDGPATLAGVKLEKILYKPRMTFQIDMEGLTMKAIDEKMKGVIFFDNRAGRIVELQQTAGLEIRAQQGDMVVNMTMDMTIGMRLKKAK
jgi:hypothetical protein